MLKRGFKSWGEKLAASYREDLGLKEIDPLCPRRLAEYLEIVVWTPDQIPDLEPEVLHRLTKTDSDSWSAVTICSEGQELIILNSSHAPSRQSNDLMHELAHVVIGHQPARMDVTEDNLLVLNTYDKDQEDEANWLAGALLVPRQALVYALSRRQTAVAIAQEFGVSPTLVNWRINATGAKVQIARSRGTAPLK